MAPPGSSGHSLLVPLLVFVAEMTVVALGTLRIIFVARGQRLLAPLLGFFEVLIWLFAITQVMQNLQDWDCLIAFALGFTLGNYVGMLVERWLALGSVVVRAFCAHDPAALVDRLRAHDYGVTCVDGRGAKGPVQIIMTVIKRRQLEEVTEMIRACQPGTFYAVEELQTTSDGVFPRPRPERSDIVSLSMQPQAFKKAG